MKLLDHIEAYKSKHRNTIEHTFLDGSKFKGYSNKKMHEFLDELYKDCIIEFKTFGTKNTVILIKSLLKL
jgi:hypothetical protein